jgi:hypothetical protein
MKDIFKYAEKQVSNSKYVYIEKKNPEIIHSSLENFQANNWKSIIHNTNVAEEYIWFEFLLNAALSGGFYQPINNKIYKWCVADSGSTAIKSWLDMLYIKNLTPMIHQSYNSIEDIEQKFTHISDGLAFKNERYAIFLELSCRKKWKKFKELMLSALSFNGWDFCWEHANNLAKIYPLSFGDDPYRKKACLFFLYLSDWYCHTSGKTILNRLPIPCENQIPRLLTHLDLIHINGELADILINKKICNADYKPFNDYRAAAILVCQWLSNELKIMNYQVCNILFSYIKTNEDFKVNALPPMMIDNLWF